MPDQDNLDSRQLQSINRISSDDAADLLTTRQWTERSYRRMHRIATTQMSFEKRNHALTATALVHEVFIRLACSKENALLAERQFLGIVASEMKRTLIDTARRKKAAKRGGGYTEVEFNDFFAREDLDDSISDLKEAVECFEAIAPDAAQLVRLRYFLGLSEDEAADAMGISRSTATRRWAFARAWLLNYLTG